MLATVPPKLVRADGCGGDDGKNDAVAVDDDAKDDDNPEDEADDEEMDEEDEDNEADVWGAGIRCMGAASLFAPLLFEAPLDSPRKLDEMGFVATAEATAPGAMEGLIVLVAAPAGAAPGAASGAATAGVNDAGLGKLLGP